MQVPSPSGLPLGISKTDTLSKYLLLCCPNTPLSAFRLYQQLFWSLAFELQQVHASTHHHLNSCSIFPKDHCLHFSWLSAASSQAAQLVILSLPTVHFKACIVLFQHQVLPASSIYIKYLQVTTWLLFSSVPFFSPGSMAISPLFSVVPTT